MEKLLKILGRIKPNTSFEISQSLFKSGEMSSLEMLSLVLGINNEFGIEIDPEDITLENFDNVHAMMKLIEKYQAAKKG